MPEVEDPVRGHAQQGDDAQERHADLHLHRPLRPQARVKPAADEAAEHRQHGQDDAVEQHLQRSPLHHPAGVDPGVEQHRGHAVDIEHPRRQEEGRVAIAAQRHDHAPQVPRPVARRRATAQCRSKGRRG